MGAWNLNRITIRLCMYSQFTMILQLNVKTDQSPLNWIRRPNKSKNNY